MSIVTDGKSSLLFMRKIKCPRHYLLIPGKEPYQTEINPMYRKLPQWAFKKFKINVERIKRDKLGQPIPNYENYYQPEISAAFAIEQIYDPKNWICSKQCKRRCFEGKGKVNEYGIKRLHR